MSLFLLRFEKSTYKSHYWTKISRLEIINCSNHNFITTEVVYDDIFTVKKTKMFFWWLVMVLCIYFWSENNLRMYKAVICDFYLEKYRLNSEENQTLKYFQTFGCDCIDIIHASWENYKFEICTKCLHNLNQGCKKLYAI